MQDQKGKKGVASKNLLSGLGKFRKGEIVTPSDTTYIRDSEKITVEIREIVRIKPQDFSALKASFEDWAKTWD